MTKPRTYDLTPDTIAKFAGGPVVCIGDRAIGRRFALFTSRPDASLNERISRRAVRADVFAPASDTADVVVPSGLGDNEGPTLTRVDIRGPIEQRAGHHDECGGWSDGHDAIAERMVTALEEGDVLLVVDSPGGAAAGIQQAIDRVVHEKAEHGRRVTVYVDEEAASAAVWWAFAVADEVYLPAAGKIGSIGARSAHGSVAGALEKEGVAVTYFAWPGAGKVAFAPELPLSDTGRSRGERDVGIAGEAFASAVIASPIGQRYGWTREKIVELDADTLTGAAAVRAGLADGVSSFDDVMTYALAMAGRTGDNSMTTKAEETPMPEKPGDKAEDVPPPAAADEADACEKCGAGNEADAKYCDQCGEPMAEEDDADASGEAARASAPPAPPSMPDKAESASTVAAMLGLRADASAPAVKTALLPVLDLARAAMKITDAKSPNEAIGKLRALAEDAAEAGPLRVERDAAVKREAYAERMDLLRKLAAANVPGYARGDLFLDREVNGKLIPQPAPAFAEMKLATLRGLVEGKLATARPRANPFEPDRAAAKAASVNAEGNAVAESRGIDVAALAARTGLDPQKLTNSINALAKQGAIQ